MMSSDLETTLAMAAGVWAVAVSAGLAVWVFVRPGADFNVLNLYTILLSALAGLLVIRRPNRPARYLVTVGLLVLSLLPVVIGIIWLAYAPAAALLLVAWVTALFRSAALGR